MVVINSSLEPCAYFHIFVIVTQTGYVVFILELKEFK